MRSSTLAVAAMRGALFLFLVALGQCQDEHTSNEDITQQVQ